MQYTVIEYTICTTCHYCWWPKPEVGGIAITIGGMFLKYAREVRCMTKLEPSAQFFLLVNRFMSFSAYLLNGEFFLALLVLCETAVLKALRHGFHTNTQGRVPMKGCDEQETAQGYMSYHQCNVQDRGPFEPWHLLGLVECRYLFLGKDMSVYLMVATSIHHRSCEGRT